MPHFQLFSDAVTLSVVPKNRKPFQVSNFFNLTLGVSIDFRPSEKFDECQAKNLKVLVHNFI